MDQTRPLRRTLHGLLDSHTHANPAFNRLLGDYSDYHLVNVVLVGAMTLLLAALSVALWARHRRTRRPATYLWLALPATFVTLLMGVVLAANISTVADPRPGFAHVIETVPRTSPGSYRARLYHSFDAWLRSGDRRLPPRIQHDIDARLAWQRPKAIICAVLLVGAALLSFRVWRALLRRKRRTLAAPAVVLSLATLVLMAMVVGNAQAAMDPIALTLLYG
jgi:hypothetical protein